ncbi:hypothetical protein [Mycolicibacterium llatzerense]|uniref:hypothetical protein n=1 Tax=Mycolicibacterium llatzerense TaxID=280871 RepID=UPI000B19EAD0|nr:hypothetical protein [Mycolicibacterium llatzerense]
MKIDVPAQMFGGDPAGFIAHLGLRITGRPSPSETVWDVAAPAATLVSGQTLHGPALKRSRFDVSTAPDPSVPGGVPRELVDRFEKLAALLDENPTLPSRFDRIVQTLVAVSDDQVPTAIRWGSNMLAAMPLQNADGTTEPLFPRHSVHDIRISETVYRWTKLPQVFLLLKRHSLSEVIAASKTNSFEQVFQSSAALLEGSVFGGLYFAPLLGNQSPLMWGIAAPRIGQVIIYTFGRLIGGRSEGASRDGLDSLQALTHFTASREFATGLQHETTLHRAVFSEAVDWWTSRINSAIVDLYSPTTYVNSDGFYVPEAHQRWMLNFEQLLSRIAAILRHPRDQAAQLTLMFPAMDMLADSLIRSSGIGQLMTPKRLRKRIAAIEQHVPQRIRQFIMAPAYRALAAAEQVADEFFVESLTTDATTESRLTALWNARRNATHGFNSNAEILAEHSGRLPSDIVLVPMVYLLDILTDRQYLLRHIEHSCRGVNLS